LLGGIRNEVAGWGSGERAWGWGWEMNIVPDVFERRLPHAVVGKPDEFDFVGKR